MKKESIIAVMMGWIIIFPSLSFSNSSALPPKLNEEQKITLLITYVRNLKGAVFIRNGSNHSPAEAADHMAMKRKKAGKKISTARDFIVFCASKSSTSGKDYLIKMPGGKTLKSLDVLMNELDRIEKNNS